MNWMESRKKPIGMGRSRRNQGGGPTPIVYSIPDRNMPQVVAPEYQAVTKHTSTPITEVTVLSQA